VAPLREGRHGCPLCWSLSQERPSPSWLPVRSGGFRSRWISRPGGVRFTARARGRRRAIADVGCQAARLFRLDGARVLVADDPSTLGYLGASASDICWEERSAWSYCQDAADLARSMSLDGVICCSAARPHDCRTIALFPPLDPQVLDWQISREGTIAALRSELAWTLSLPLSVRSGVEGAAELPPGSPG